MEMARAIAAGEFSVYYQPRFAAGTLVPVSAEALVRWTARPDMSPDRFIPRLERNGAIEPLTMFVVATVCQDIHRLRNALGVNPKISINISPALFSKSLFADGLLDFISMNGIRPSMIEMEITESFVTHDLGAVVTSVTKLRDAGFEIALDDFGTGMSSLHYLDILPASTIKIDRHFVTGIGARPTCERIVASVLDMARAANVSTVVEGVETVAQLKYVSDLGCNEAQGFLLAHPMPFNDFLAFMLRHHKPRLQLVAAIPPLHTLSPEGC